MNDPEANGMGDGLEALRGLGKAAVAEDVSRIELRGLVHDWPIYRNIAIYQPIGKQSNHSIRKPV